MSKLYRLLPLLLLLSCGKSKEPATMTLLSYNVGVFSKYEDNTIPQVADVIRSADASLVALNELDSCNRRHANYQLQDLAGELGGWSFQFASAFPFANGAYGNGVVSALPILKRDIINLPRMEGMEPRSVAVVETPTCVFASVHLDVKGSRVDQARIINDWFTSRYSGYGKPVFLCGDMNDLPGSPALLELEKCWLRLSPDSPTYPASSRCIDHIFAFRSAVPVEVVSSEVISEGVDMFSDHYPIIVTVIF